LAKLIRFGAGFNCIFIESKPFRSLGCLFENGAHNSIDPPKSNRIKRSLNGLNACCGVKKCRDIGVGLGITGSWQKMGEILTHKQAAMVS